MINQLIGNIQETIKQSRANTETILFLLDLCKETLNVIIIAYTKILALMGAQDLYFQNMDQEQLF